MEGAPDSVGAVRHLPSIRFIPHQDPRAGRPSLIFPTINRTLPDESAIIRVGRYSERDNLPEIQTNAPSAAAVGFKSKVVSRKHCELWCKDGSWYIKDVKSSSGTFLNHIRLSQPNVESKPFRIKDGDIIQLGIDFRGGEEMIFRCVKIRVECNRGWQQGLNTFKYVWLAHTTSSPLTPTANKPINDYAHLPRARRKSRETLHPRIRLNVLFV
jgi:pSer/pThr/pTyr-binding forkhead associated (FHA) protein